MTSSLSSAPLDLRAPVTGNVIAIEVQRGQRVHAGQVLVLLESMKMEFPVVATGPGEVLSLLVAVGEAVQEGEAVLRLQPLAPGELADEDTTAGAPLAPAADAAPRADLQRLFDRRQLLSDDARGEAVDRRHAGGLRTARENVADLLDAGSFTEYGGFAVAAQRTRRALDELQRQTPADGLVCGTGTVEGRPIGVLAYDYTVLAGTQGVMNHRKSDRVLEVAERLRLPLVWFAEGGGGRPGDVDWPIVAGLDCTSCARWAALSGVVPRIGVVAGRCFAGNAALLGCSDLIVAVMGASIGLGGPAMIEGGGLGRVAADEVGPLSVMAPNVVVDVVVLVGGSLGVFAYVTGSSVYSKCLFFPYIPGSGELLVFCCAMAGAGLAFLWFNTHPAQVFMGDVGALALGGALGTIAVIVRQEIVLSIMGGIFVAEALSVMLQVSYFKYTKKKYGEGRRILKMAPLHHHFEKSGWKETQVVVRFWIITMLLCLVGLSTLKLR